MALKNFDDYIKTRLCKKEIIDIEKQAKAEIKMFKSWQESIKQTLNDYMKKNNVGFNDLVRILDISPTQIAKIKKGQANLTISSMISIFSALDKEPKLVFKKK